MSGSSRPPAGSREIRNKQAQSLLAQRKLAQPLAGAQHRNQEGTGLPWHPSPQMIREGGEEARTQVGLFTCKVSALESEFPPRAPPPLGFCHRLGKGDSEQGTTENTAAKILRGWAEGQGLSPDTIILEGPRGRRPVAGPRHTRHTTHACTSHALRHATHVDPHCGHRYQYKICHCSQTLVPDRHTCNITYTAKAAYMQTHQGPHIHKCVHTELT